MDRAGDQRRPPHRGRLALPCPPPPRDPQLDRRGVGHLREQSPGKVLHPHPEGPSPTPPRDRNLDAFRVRRLRCPRGTTANDMTPIPAWRRYLRFWRPNIAEDVDAELRFHTEMRVREYMT